MRFPRKREKFIISDEMSTLIRSLSGLDRDAFDKKIPKLLQSFFGEDRIIWVPAPVVVEQTPARLKNVLTVNDNHGHTIAFVVLMTSNDRRQKRESIPPDWPLLEKIIAGLYQAAITLSEAKKLAYVDDVTQLFNQRYLHLVLEKEVSKSEQSNSSFSALFIDIDHFKNVNDSNGHLVGSQLLVEVSNILRQNIRADDYAFRYGGDEFILLLVGSNKEEAQQVGERIRNQVEMTAFVVDGRDVRLTLSIGIASFPEHARTKDEIIRIADEAMYEGKNRSRNIVSVAS